MRFYYNSAEDLTLCKVSFSYSSIENRDLVRKVFSKTEFLKMCKQIEGYIYCYSPNLSFSDSIIVKTNYDKIWKVFMKNEELLKIIPNLNMNIKYEGPINDEGSIVRIGK